jgi:modulator of FtsH protease HflK
MFSILTSGGPWGQRNQGPWGGGPQGGGSGGGSGGNGGGGGGGTPPDLEAILRRGQDKLKDFMPGGGMSGRGMALGLIAVVVLWLATGVYTVRPDEVGLNMIFGRYVGKTDQGVQYNLPYPIGSVIKPRVTTVNTTEVGFRSGDGSARRAGLRDVAEESLMLTGDENIVDVDFAVQWQINPARAEDFVFNIQSPEASIKAVAESAMREVIGRRNIQAVLTTDRGAVEAEVKQLMQDVLNQYRSGVELRIVQLLKVDPPSQVIDAFRDVQAARQDQDRVKNEAETYASRIVPEARGQALRVIQDAEGYRERTIAEAQGAASRFTQVYEEYRKAPEVTRARMFLETMERVYSGMDKVIIDQKTGGSGVVPFLPLDQLQRRGAAGQQGTQR